ncbi:MAG: glycosyl hydrolase [Treponema sp.]|nr:glycosyl hydrolase [Treponema sp.]
MKYDISINGNEKLKFNNNVDFCVGTGRMGLALTKEYLDQLKIVQDNIGFKFIRGHGLFCDDIGIYQVYNDTSALDKKPADFPSYKEYFEYLDANGKKSVEYNFTYFDRVVDSYLELNIRPFLELGFMPKKMASGDQTVFYWKGNTTPPADYSKWTDMVKATLRHLIERYGEEEVLAWPIEVWNEPNLPGFWKNADIDEYFKLYELTAKAVKEVNPAFRVGGPAICGGADEKWMKGFLNFLTEKKPPIDFITRHHYTTELPVDKGHYGYAKLMPLDETLQTLRDCRKIIDAYPDYKDLPFYITEFNTSYIPNCPLHDTNLNAAYIARTLAEIGDYVTGYSYWTFGDVFEERGIPFTPFHGGFGLLANGGIQKPTYWTFKFFKDLKENEENCVYRDKNIVIVKTKDGSYKGIAWNLTLETKEQEITFNIKLPQLKGRNCLLVQTVDEATCNPAKLWHDLGEPANPTAQQTELLQAAAKPLYTTTVLQDKSDFALTATRNAVIYFEIKPSPITSDNGFDWDFYDKME